MAHIINLNPKIDHRGSLLPIESKDIGFEIKRVFYIYGVPNENIVRDGHRHHRAIQALIAIAGSCIVKNNDGIIEEKFILDNPMKCLILDPKDWHTMENFTKDCILMILSSIEYDKNDYIVERYE
jgi:hypothetical protein